MSWQRTQLGAERPRESVGCKTALIVELVQSGGTRQAAEERDICAGSLALAKAQVDPRGRKRTHDPAP
jgi:hypothetical protein